MVMPIDLKRVVGATVIYRTYHLAFDAITSTLNYYPWMRIIVIDNTEKGFTNGREKVYDGLKDKIELVRVNQNIGHGPGIKRAMQRADEGYLYLFDTDTKMYRPLILEKMALVAKDDVFLGIGQLLNLIYLYKGVRLQYIHPATCLFHLGTVKKFKWPIDHGDPLVEMMLDLHNKGKMNLLKQFPVGKFVHHFKRGSVNACRASGVKPSFERKDK
jgi:hypothetical protein